MNNNRFRGSILVKAPISPEFENDYNVVVNRFASNGEGDLRIRLTEWQSLGFEANSLIALPDEIFANLDFRFHRLKEGRPI